MTITSIKSPMSSFIVWFLSCFREMLIISAVAMKAVAFRWAAFQFSSGFSFLFTVLSDFSICSCCLPWRPVCKYFVGDGVPRIIQAETPKPDDT